MVSIWTVVYFNNVNNRFWRSTYIWTDKKILTCTAKLFGNSVLAVIIHAFAANASDLRASFARKTRYSSSEIVFVSPTTGAIIKKLLFPHPSVLAKLNTTDYVYSTRAHLCTTAAIFDPRLPLVLVFLLNDQ